MIVLPETFEKSTQGQLVHLHVLMTQPSHMALSWVGPWHTQEFHRTLKCENTILKNINKKENDKWCLKNLSHVF